MIFTDLPHPNVGDIDGDYIQLYVSIVETQTWWQILSNGPSMLWAGVSKELGVVELYLEPRHPGTRRPRQGQRAPHRGAQAAAAPSRGLRLRLPELCPAGRTGFSCF